MSPSPRAALLLVGCAVLSLLAGPAAGVLAGVAVVAATFADAVAARGRPSLRRSLAPVVARGVPVPLSIATAPDALVRQPLPADVEAEPRQAVGGLEARLVALRRGRHVMPPVMTRRHGPLGLGRWDHRVGGEAELLVYPDFPAARRLAVAVRRGRLREAGVHARGPLGLGTDFESIRDYLPDDDIRQVNWPATQRMQRPMSNQYRVEQDREVLLLLDAGRLMAAPLGRATRLDVAIDAAAAVALVADELGDRCGVLAFDRTVRRRLDARRAGGRGVVRALFDLEPRADDADYELAFRLAEGGKRALIVLFTDLVDTGAARSLLDAIPVLARRHAVIVVSATDPEIEARAEDDDRWRALVARDVLAAREEVALRLRHTGTVVVEAAAADLPAQCVRAYLRVKSRARA